MNNNLKCLFITPEDKKDIDLKINNNIENYILNTFHDSKEKILDFTDTRILYLKTEDKFKGCAIYRLLTNNDIFSILEKEYNWVTLDDCFGFNICLYFTEEYKQIATISLTVDLGDQLVDIATESIKSDEYLDILKDIYKKVLND